MSAGLHGCVTPLSPPTPVVIQRGARLPDGVADEGDEAAGAELGG